MGQVSEGRVARLARTAEWSLVRGAEVAAGAHETCRPDGRWFVSIDGWDEAADAPLLTAMVEDLRQDLHTNVDGADEAELQRWQRLGFVPARREILLAVPVDPAMTGLSQSVPLDGIVLLRPTGSTRPRCESWTTCCAEMSRDAPAGSTTRWSSASTPSTNGSSTR